jgi:hypothetical protein
MCIDVKNSHVSIMCIYVYIHILAWCDLLEQSMLSPGAVFMCFSLRAFDWTCLHHVIDRRHWPPTLQDMTWMSTWICSPYHMTQMIPDDRDVKMSLFSIPYDGCPYSSDKLEKPVYIIIKKIYIHIQYTPDSTNDICIYIYKYTYWYIIFKGVFTHMYLFIHIRMYIHK